MAHSVPRLDGPAQAIISYLWKKSRSAEMSQPTISVQESPYWERKWFPWAVFGSLSLIYLLNRSPYVGFHDGLSFLYSASRGFDLGTNATSHFLYHNLLHVLLRMFFFLPDVLVLTVSSICCSLGTLLLVYRTAGLLTPGRGARLLLVITLGLSFTFWQQSEIIEVYAFNNLLFSAFLYISLKDILAQHRSRYMLASLWLGLGLITHIQHVLSIPFFIAYLWWGNWLRPWQKVLGMLPWMGCMGILVAMPALTHAHHWTAVFIETKFQNNLFGWSLPALLKGIALGVGMLLYNFHLALLPAVAGWWEMWAGRRSLFIWLAVLGFPYLAFAWKYTVNDNHVFYLCFHIVLVLPMVGWAEKITQWKARWMQWMIPVAALAPITMYAVVTVAARQVPMLEKYDRDKAYKGGLVHLLWPGKAWARDPLELARKIHEAKPCGKDSAMPEWNYPVAERYLYGQEPAGALPCIHFQL
jgi:hypothetical protein